ncbi:hypothetical protein [Saccharomonospora cyanea]|uniref:Uncharacterized protein n=1 Tax=Saccharomonospora cyanea NA-134 TaxID=882082 RepID=H5XMK1_9PSEU|nr:hypothetical protein [Saccharomonospora cyanea]EHR59938.1 hypothetical protein SaccyDRAFT_1025 [Saccharomonospora cyanea NA-134]
MPDLGPPNERARRAHEQLAVPVLAAALVSVPAVFLTTTPGVTGTIGTILNWLSLAVLLGESATLLWVSGSARVFVRRYRFQLLIVALAVPAVVFVVGPVQVLRVLLAFGAFRILKVRRILRAGRVIVHRFGLDGRRGAWVLAGAAVAATAFACVVLADPESHSRRVLTHVVDHLGVGGTAVAALGVVHVLLVVVVLLRHDTRW